MKTNQVSSVSAINNNSGFSIIEILIFTLLSSLILISMTIATIISVRNSKFSQNKTVSTRYTQQVQEWLRGQRDIDWQTFVSALSDDTSYCLNTIPSSIAELDTNLVGCGYSLGNIYKRLLKIISISDDNNEVTYTVTTYWRDGTTINSSQATGLLSSWE